MTTKAPARTTVQRPYCICLPPGPAAATEARRHIWAIVHAWDIPIDAYAAALLTSELVANATKHDTDEYKAVQLMISWVDDQLRVEVQDKSQSGPAGADAAATTSSDMAAGRGLILVRNARRRYLRFRDSADEDRQGNR